MKVYTKRFTSGQDLLEEVEKFVQAEKIMKGCLLSAIGSVDGLHVKLNNGQSEAEWPEQHEVLSLSGPVSVEGSHIHVAGANREGVARGGHLLPGTPVSLFVEVAIGEYE